MGAGTFSLSDYSSYSTSRGAFYDSSTGRVTGQSFIAHKLDSSLNPRNFEVRECCNTEEHPNTIPVILALDVTGSMGAACSETAAALGIIMTNLYDKFKDVEFCVMGIGDLAYDNAPIQMSQFESDIRIAEALDKIYMEHGGGGNGYESYTAAWYMGLKRTKLDAFDKQGRKGIIITMGDEPLNPYLPKDFLNACIVAEEEKDVETPALFRETLKKFDIFHIAVDDESSSCEYYKEKIKNSWGQIIGRRLKFSSIDTLAEMIEKCITESVEGVASEIPSNATNENGEISW